MTSFCMLAYSTGHKTSNFLLQGIRVLLASLITLYLGVKNDLIT